MRLGSGSGSGSNGTSSSPGSPASSVSGSSGSGPPSADVLAVARTVPFSGTSSSLGRSRNASSRLVSPS
ncbi:MAG TPA: hypothetical protein ENN87_05645 [Phycisphaerales bacterium]|nr:hypothetical protein [Phycisphaerales bacterium]